MSDSVELLPDTDSDKTMNEVQAASSAVAPPSGVGRPLPAGNGLPGSVGGVGGDDRPRLSMYQGNREFVQQINIMNNMIDYAEVGYAVTETEHEAERRHQTAMARFQHHQEVTAANRDEQFQKEYNSLMAYSDEMYSRQEFEFACQKRNLIAELSEYQRVCSRQIANNENMEGTIQALKQAHQQSLRTFQEEQCQYLTGVFEEHHQSEMGILNERFAETETVMEQQNSSLQDELMAAESALRKEKAARKEAPLLGEVKPPPGLRTAFERAPDGPELPPPSPFKVPAGMKTFLDKISNPPSITGFATPQTPRSMADAAPKGQPNFPAAEATTAPRPGNLPGSSANPDFAGFIEAQKAMFESFKGEKPKPSEEEKPKVKEAESIKLPEFPKPETYRSWKTATREAIRAASDQPDEAFKWVLEVYDKDADHQKLREPGKFLTLDTKLLAALTNR